MHTSIVDRDTSRVPRHAHHRGRRERRGTYYGKSCNPKRKKEELCVLCALSGEESGGADGGGGFVEIIQSNRRDKILWFDCQ
jgi:hypothetical protein